MAFLPDPASGTETKKEGAAMRKAVPSPEIIAQHRKPGEDEPEVLIAGFGRMGQRIATLMQQAGVRYVAIEQRLPMVAKGRDNDYAVYFGNAAQPDVLHSAGVAHAK